MTTSRRHPSNFGIQNGALPEYQSSEHILNRGRMPALAAPPWPLRAPTPEHLSVLNRIPQPADGEMPVNRLVHGRTYDALNVDRPLVEMERHGSSLAPASIEWPPLPHTQSQTLPPIPPDIKHIRSSSGNLDIRSFVTQGASSSVFVPRHQYDTLDRKTVGIGGLAQPSYQHPDSLSSSQPNLGIVGNQAQTHRPPQFHPRPHPQEAFRSFSPAVSASQFQGQGGNAAAAPLPFLPSSFSVSPVPPYGMPATANFPLPPLPPGPAPSSLQMGSSSSQVGGPQPFVSGLLSNLMRHGVISLEASSEPQVFLMHLCNLLLVSSCFCKLLLVEALLLWIFFLLGLCWS
jgi:pre-mRNA cleavage complex 2 protein Pcf11